MLLIGDNTKGSLPLDEDSKAVLIVEESATRSDVVYGFAEVKYKQLIPVAPSMEQGLGLRQVGIPEGGDGTASAAEDEGLTPDAVVTLSEEALVLYVKALSLLARSMDIAGAWWARKNRGGIIDDGIPSKVQTNAAVGNRVNNVVQWVRSRFNEVLGKAEFVRAKLIEAQQQLPLDHPSHPNNHPAVSKSMPAMGTSADNVVVSVGVTAEKLMYDRALEMSRSAAVNELVGEDLPGCEIAYITAIRMLEAVLEDDDEFVQKKPGPTEKDSKNAEAEESSSSGVEAEDRKVVVKSSYDVPGSEPQRSQLYSGHEHTNTTCGAEKENANDLKANKFSQSTITIRYQTFFRRQRPCNYISCRCWHTSSITIYYHHIPSLR